MNNNNSEINGLITLVNPIVKSFVDIFVTPKLESFRKKIGDSKNNKIIPTEEHFNEYLNRTYKKLAVVNTLVFNNSQRLLKDIFIPLTLSSSNKINENKNEKIKVSGFPTQISDEYGNILITDTAGMGKSTLMKIIFIDTISQNISIPIFLELRRLNHSKKIIDELKEQLSPIDKSFDTELLLKLIIEGGFVFILDGYDEIALNDREIVTNDIQDFISKASKNRFFITSRPEKALTCFGNFQEFKILPLTKEEAFELLRKYDNQGQISNLLINKLQEKELENISEFLTNPLLVTLLFTAFEHKQAIPFKKYLFYRQVYDANFESHDLTKGDSYTHDKYSKLEIDDFHRVLRFLGYRCLILQKIEFTKDDLIKLILDSKNFCAGVNFNESEFLEDILKTVPLFTQDGNYYRWSHKSLQEYFSAQFIYLDSKEKQDSILLKFFNNINIEKFINVLDLYYEMDYKTFRNVIEYNLLKEYSEYSNRYYNSIKNGINYSNAIRRKELTFLINSYIFKANNFPFNDNRFIKMYEKLNKNKPDEFSSIREIIIRPFPTNNFYCIHFQSAKNALLLLLFKKKNSIIKFVEEFQINNNFELDIEFIKEYIPKKIVDNIEDELNNQNNFQKVNELLEITRFQKLP